MSNNVNIKRGKKQLFYIHYAIQTCDVSSYQGQKRFASDNRTDISKKSIKSFLQSVRYCSQQYSDSFHHVAIIKDRCTDELNKFIQKCFDEFSSERLKIDILELEGVGIKRSIESCYYWLQDNGKDLVYQVQDDYMFTESAITDMVNMFQQIKIETNSECIISPWNDSWLWLTFYRNKSTPRAVIVGKRGYWIQYYDMSCSFLTSHNQFSQHWDLYHVFFDLIDKPEGEKNKPHDLENVSLNYMLTLRGVLGLVPINSLAFHLQSELEKDPHIDYKPLWDSIDCS